MRQLETDRFISRSWREGVYRELLILIRVLQINNSLHRIKTH